MNPHVEQPLRELVEDLENEIDWGRDRMSYLNLEASSLSRRLTEQIAQRRAILDHLETNK
jgi:hypothetical protein